MAGIPPCARIRLQTPDRSARPARERALGRQRYDRMARPKCRRFKVVCTVAAAPARGRHPRASWNPMPGKRRRHARRPDPSQGASSRRMPGSGLDALLRRRVARGSALPGSGVRRDDVPRIVATSVQPWQGRSAGQDSRSIPAPAATTQVVDRGKSRERRAEAAPAAEVRRDPVSSPRRSGPRAASRRAGRPCRRAGCRSGCRAWRWRGSPQSRRRG